jgi:hypothetical protein
MSSKQKTELAAGRAQDVVLKSEEVLLLDVQEGPSRRIKGQGLLRGYWPLTVVLAIYWITVAAVVWHSVQLNQGYLNYPLDDTYIHMSMAKNASLHGVWGVTSEQFSSTTSSPLWTALLAAVYWIAGVGILAPLVLNLVFGSLIVVIAFRLMRQSGSDAAWTTVVLLALVFLSALPTLTFIGMEHTLHALVMLLFMLASAKVMSSAKSPTPRRVLGLAVLAVLLTSARYEGLFALAGVVVLLVLTRKWTAAAMVSVGGMLPVVFYGWWSTLHGSYILPNSVLLKGNTPHVTVAGIAQLLLWWAGLKGLVANPHLLLLLAASLAVLVMLSMRSTWDQKIFLNIIFVAVTLLHVEFIRGAGFYRYDGYLLIVGITILGASASDWATSFRRSVEAGMKPAVMAASALLALLILTPLTVRAAQALHEAARASHNVYEQQRQMALFLDRFYSGRSIAANDIGEITYLANIKLVDLYGLGTVEVARWKLAGNYTTAQIDALTRERGVDIAIVYDAWFTQYGGLPSSWHKVGEWAVQDSVILGGSEVSFYALRPAENIPLTRDLKAFASRLPPDVQQRGEYTK